MKFKISDEQLLQNIFDILDEVGIEEIPNDEIQDTIDYILEELDNKNYLCPKPQKIRKILEEYYPVGDYIEEPIILNGYHITDTLITDENIISSNQEQIEKVKLIPQHEQRSLGWYKMRENMLTASSIACIIDKNPYQTRTKYLAEKCGFIEGFKGGPATEWGVKYEPVATEVYSHIYNKKVYEFGLIPHPVYNFIGASPDGITEDGIMLEIKVPPTRAITGKPPIYYWVQMQIQMEVCDLDLCHFTELKIVEYPDEMLFWADSDENQHWKSHNGEYKGAVIIYYDTEINKNEYIHCPIEYTYESLTDFIDNVKQEYNKKENMVFSNVSYHKVETISIIPIERDKKWFNDNIQNFTDFYKEIQYYKEKGKEEFNKKYNLFKEKPKQYTQQPTGFMLMDD